MGNKIKILQTLVSLGQGGTETFVMNFYRNFNKEKFQVDFVIYDDTRMDFYQEIIENGSQVYICKKNYNNKYLQMLSQISQVRRILKENQYNVIHCHSCAILGILRGAVAGWLTKGVKVISHSHGPGKETDSWGDRIVRSIMKGFLCSIVDYGFSCSDVAGESKYTKSFIQGNRYQVIHNAIEIERFQFNEEIRTQVRKQLGIHKDMVIGNVGRLAQEKNQGFLLDIIAYLKSKHINAKLIIVGGGELEASLKEQADRLCISDSVIFTGKTQNPERYYSAMDVFVMPSLYEGLPFTAVEAQVNGLKCVMSDTVSSMVNISGDVEFLSLEESVEVWADKIRCNAQSRSELKKTEIVCQEYDLKLEARKVEQYYEH